MFLRKRSPLLRRTCCAVVALFVSAGAAFAQTHFAARPHVRPRVIVVHRFHPFCYYPYAVQVPYLYPGPYSVPASYSFAAPNTFVPSGPDYVFGGSNSPARLQLVFKDGTTYFVSDWWKEGDQLHFITMEEGGTKSVPHNVQFDSLDLPKTKEAAGAQGFRFVIRDEPIQQWLEHHAQHPRRPTTPVHPG